MRVRLLVGALLLGAGLGVAAVACGDDENDGCPGEIINSCANCSPTCSGDERITCTAWPEGDTTSRDRCCRCE